MWRASAPTRGSSLSALSAPPVDELEPVPAAVAVDRQAPVKTSRSTVATMTEVADYAKSLWARAAQRYCDGCGEAVTRDTPETAAHRAVERLAGERVYVTYAAPAKDAEAFIGVRDALVRDGYRRALIAGEVVDLDTVKPSQIKRAGHIEVVADRAVAKKEERRRLIEALEASFRRGGGRASVVSADSKKREDFSAGLHCAKCDRGYRDASPGLFSFNSPVGACPKCRGFGRVITIDWDLVLPDDTRALSEGAIRPWQGKGTAWERRDLAKFAAKDGIPMDLPLSKFTPASGTG
jgi:excinuclease ABC subunit A